MNAKEHIMNVIRKYHETIRKIPLQPQCAQPKTGAAYAQTHGQRLSVSSCFLLSQSSLYRMRYWYEGYLTEPCSE